jgi:hypothetical protein
VITRITLPALAALALLAVLAAAPLLAGCGGEATAGDVSTASPSPAPAWLASEAAELAARFHDPSPDAAYWGYLRDPELGSLTSSGPDDPSHAAYVIVLIGEFATVTHAGPPSLSSPAPTAQPEAGGPSRWVLMTYGESHEASVFGCGPHEFDVSAFPSLQPLAL